MSADPDFVLRFPFPFFFLGGGGVCVCERENITLFYSPDVSRKYIYVWTSFEPTAGESGDQAVVCVPLPIGAKLQEKFLLTQWRDAGTRRWNCPPYCTPHWRWGRKRLRERCQIASKGDHPFWGGLLVCFCLMSKWGDRLPPKNPCCHQSRILCLASLAGCNFWCGGDGGGGVKTLKINGLLC